MPADHEDVAGGALSSWKEVAEYLGVTVRTAQLWEKRRGLPVRRLPGPRSRIEADSVELDRWKSRYTPDPAVVPALAPNVSPRRRFSWFPLMSGALLLVGSFVLLGFWHQHPRQPASFRIERNALVVLDSNERVLWRKEFPYVLERGVYTGGADGRYAWIGDLDGDGRNEVLFIPAFAADTSLAHPLICFGADGVERWRYTSRRVLRTVTESFAPVYVANRFLPIPARAGSPGLVFVSNLHRWYYPCQIARLNTKGVLEAEYWHSGHLNYLALGQDHGRTVLYAAGVSNAWKAATLLALDPEHLAGASQEPEAPSYQLLDLPRGAERARVILPRSKLNDAVHVYNSAADLVARPDRVIVTTEEDPGAASGAGVLHEFSPDLREHTARISDQYQSVHRRLEMTGVLREGITSAEINALEHVRVITGTGNPLQAARRP